MLGTLYAESSAEAYRPTGPPPTMRAGQGSSRCGNVLSRRRRIRGSRAGRTRRSMKYLRRSAAGRSVARFLESSPTNDVAVRYVHAPSLSLPSMCLVHRVTSSPVPHAHSRRRGRPIKSEMHGRHATLVRPTQRAGLHGCALTWSLQLACGWSRWSGVRDPISRSRGSLASASLALCALRLAPRLHVRPSLTALIPSGRVCRTIHSRCPLAFSLARLHACARYLGALRLPSFTRPSIPECADSSSNGCVCRTIHSRCPLAFSLARLHACARYLGALRLPSFTRPSIPECADSSSNGCVCRTIHSRCPLAF